MSSEKSAEEIAKNILERWRLDCPENAMPNKLIYSQRSRLKNLIAAAIEQERAAKVVKWPSEKEMWQEANEAFDSNECKECFIVGFRRTKELVREKMGD